jgi:hypothetical protein
VSVTGIVGSLSPGEEERYRKCLKTYFGYTSFRPLQVSALVLVLAWLVDCRHRLDRHSPRMSNTISPNVSSSLKLEMIRACLEGRDSFLCMATGAGKSLCYQLPALLTQKAHTTPSAISCLALPCLALHSHLIIALTSHDC